MNNRKKPQKPASKIREMLEKLNSGEDIVPCRTIYTKPNPLTTHPPYIDMSVSNHYTEMNEEIEEMCDPRNWEPPNIENSLGLFNWVNRGLNLAEGNPKLEAQMLRSVFGLICENLDDRTSKRIAQAILDR